MTLMRWDPFREVMILRKAVDRLLGASFIRPSRWLTPVRKSLRILPIDMYETDEEIVVKVSVPGIRPDDLDIQVRGDLLTIQGETKAEEKGRRGDYLYQERHYGRFSRTVRLPVAVEADKAEAIFENGVLTLTLPKVEEARAKVIKVKAK